MENRVIGIDTNPYLSIAASLACGYLGMIEGIKPRPPVDHEIYEGGAELPGSLTAALKLFEADTPLRDALGEEFCKLYADIKWAELEEYQREISPWERQHLLLNA